MNAGGSSEKVDKFVYYLQTYLVSNGKIVYKVIWSEEYPRNAQIGGFFGNNGPVFDKAASGPTNKLDYEVDTAALVFGNDMNDEPKEITNPF